MNFQQQSGLSNLAHNSESAYLPSMTEADLRCITNTMSIKKPAGIDQIRLRDIVHNFDKLKIVLLAVLNGIFKTGVIPTGLKSAIVRPLFKGGNKKDVGNYRPLSIMPVISHIMEKHIANTINSFCDKFDLINKAQYGFRKGKSTTSLLEDFTDVVNKTLDENNIGLALFLDLSKAFDTIDHSKMLQKLFALGLRGPFFQFFENYFSNRTQRVKIKNYMSKTVMVNYGIPQGSSLAPLLFNIFVNDLGTLKLQSKLFMYADDTALILPHEKYEVAVTIFQNDINVLMNWFSENRIFVNSKKTKLMCFRNPHKRVVLDRFLYLCEPKRGPQIYTEINYEASIKYLGLHFDEHMTWEYHVDYIKKRLRIVSSYIYRIGTAASTAIKQNIYRALGESVLRYGILVYGSCSNNRLQTVNKLIFRIVNNISYGTQFQQLDLLHKLEQFNILPLHILFKYIVITTHYFSRTEFKQPVRKRPLRKAERFYLPRIHTLYGKRLRGFYIPCIFNDIPEELMDLGSLKSVKEKFRTWCLQKYI